MGFSNEGCCCCGVVTGFLLAAAIGGGIAYFVYCQAHPDAPKRDLKKVSRTWEFVKSGGDALLEKARQETGRRQLEPVEKAPEPVFIPEPITTEKE